MQEMLITAETLIPFPYLRVPCVVPRLRDEEGSVFARHAEVNEGGLICG
jgi:hypothetical protein